MVLVAGEAGIGKTVLLRAFAERAPVPVLWGMCDSLSTPRPLGPLRDVADELGPAVAAVLREAGPARDLRRGAGRAAAPARACSSSRTCTGVTRRRWTSSASSRAASRALPLLLVLSYRDAPGRRTRWRRCSATSSPARTRGGCSSPR